MRIFTGILDRAFFRKATPLGTQPVLASMVDFASDAVMQSVMEDYRRDRQAWPDRHLPVVVGQLRPEAMRLLTGVADDPEINLHFNFRRTDFKQTARVIAKRIASMNVEPKSRVPAKTQAHIARGNLHLLWAQLASEVFAQDVRWFGQPLVPSMTLHRETIIPPNSWGLGGKGRFSFAGTPHRDCLSDDNAAFSRLYLVRTENPFWALPNHVTRGVVAQPDGYISDPRLDALRVRHARRPLAGQIMLVNGGRDTGTVHGSTIPGPQQGGPSFFAAINCVL